MKRLPMGMGGSLFLGMLVTAGVGILLGCGLPTLAAYALVAILMAPMLHTLGAGLIAAHLFCLYYAALASITPPIAVSALVASKLADAPFIPTAIRAAKLSAGNFLLPFFIILCPVLTLQGSIGFGMISYITLILGFVGLSVGIVGYCMRATNPLERLLFIASGAVLLSFIVFGSCILLLVGFVMLASLVLRQMAKVGNTGYTSPA